MVPAMANVTHPGRPRGEDPHIKSFTKNKKEVIEYIVPDNLLDELGIDEHTFKELQALFELFDLDMSINFKTWFAGHLAAGHLATWLLATWLHGKCPTF